MQPFFNESGEACIPEEKFQKGEELRRLLKKLELLDFSQLVKSITWKPIIFDFRKIEREEEKKRFGKFLENLESIGVYTDSYRHYLEQPDSLEKNLDLIQSDVIEIETNKVVEWLKKMGLFVYNSHLKYLFRRNCDSHDCRVCFEECRYSLYSGSFRIRDYCDFRNKMEVFQGGTVFVSRIISEYLENQRVSKYSFMCDMHGLINSYTVLSTLEYLSSAKFFEVYYSMANDNIDFVLTEIAKIERELCYSEGKNLQNCKSIAHKYWKDIASSGIFKNMNARIKENIRIDKQKTRTLSLLLGINEDFDDDLLQDAVEMIDYENL